MSQGVLFGPDPESVSKNALVTGVQATLEALEEANVLQPQHRGLVELLRAEARDYVMAHGIARTNYARLIGEHLTMLLEMEAPSTEEDDDAAGDRVTKLSAYLNARRLEADVRDSSPA